MLTWHSLLLRRRFYVKLDTDTFFNVQQARELIVYFVASGIRSGTHGQVPQACPQRRPHLSGRSNLLPYSQAVYKLTGHVSVRQVLGSRLPDYIGHAMNIFSYKGRKLTYMQGGGYILSRRAASAVASCQLGEWKHCPALVFRDMHDPISNARLRANCTDKSTNAEDLYVGACLRDKAESSQWTTSLKVFPHRGFMTATHGTLHYGEFSATESFNATMTRVSLRRTCSITLHPIKGPEALQLAREVSRIKGCWKHRPPSPPPPPLPPLPPPPDERFSFLEGKQYTSGGTLLSATANAQAKAGSPNACALACLAAPRCQKFTFKRVIVKRGRESYNFMKCFLKTEVATLANDACLVEMKCVSGFLRLRERAAISPPLPFSGSILHLLHGVQFKGGTVRMASTSTGVTTHWPSAGGFACTEQRIPAHECR